ncbi:ABC transporter substrate-binding protein [Mycolicibacterium novocastrense]|uniref:acyclic terpene utilization AtuA family protein n=1 Tax=Mycolicibacterium novocastrense TaxID=59813 RepID=UPI000745F7AF|nr:acyclic terpene utilization AtuA family protein [Mycolicibacterium novocastrense]KUH69820.1 ABC transporter substrate-binding protein [Mycolicibacterium novocastrense]KUH71369.1 ABC transporter substrate-binding protein [Mycolicibacterium novocastrense]KUH74433.1 ABC transporter substrate-binding protein [Mycolicibacterium novocastrense]
MAVTRGRKEITLKGQTLRIGAGAAWWGDRVEPAALSAEKGDLDYLCFETMAEATISAAQVRTRRDPSFQGYDTYLEDRMRAVLPACMRRGTRIVSNQGWINPDAAARRVAELLREAGYLGVKIAAVNGSLIADRVLSLTDRILENGEPTATLAPNLISAEAYLGAEPLVQALRDGAQIVISGRVADPSIFMAPMMYEFGWDPLDHERLGRGSGLGHLMECGAQVTGGYFSDPGFKEVPDPWNLGFPIAEVTADGNAVLTKVAGTGGAVNLRTVKEQMLYEVHDPANYLTPDVVVDFTTAQIEEVAPDRVRVTGITGKPRPPTLKVSIGCTEGFIGEDMFFYAGPGALRRAQLAKRVLEERFRIVNLQAEDVRIDFLGMNAIHGGATSANAPEPYELAVRVAARTRTREEAAKVGREVDGMAVSGIGHTGKRVPHQDRTREVIGVWSSVVSRDQVPASINYFES